MSEVKRFDFDIDEAGANIRFVELVDGGYTLFTDLDAERLRADTAEAEIEVLKREVECRISNEVNAVEALATAEQRIAELLGLLKNCADCVRNGEDFDLPVTTMAHIDAAPNPNPEAESQ